MVAIETSTTQGVRPLAFVQPTKRGCDVTTGAGNGGRPGRDGELRLRGRGARRGSSGGGMRTGAPGLRQGPGQEAARGEGARE